MAAECRQCSNPLSTVFVDLGVSPLANSFLKADQLNRMEPFYPLRAYVCDRCFLVQLEEFQRAHQIFSEYAYFSSFSTSWVEHARRYADMMRAKLSLGSESFVVEIASNDGYLLQHFQRAGIPVLGIEPARNVAQAAIERNIPTRIEFFDRELAMTLVSEGMTADLIVGNNVLAHVPDLHSFVAGIKILLKPRGVVTFEFPHLLQLLRYTQFDTIYHEHFSYLSLLSAEQVLLRHGLTVFDVEELPTHGGSLRVYGKHIVDDSKPITRRLEEVRACEGDARLNQLTAYRGFSEKVIDIKCDLLRFLIDCRQSGKRVVGYGAPAKGNTLLNYCGIGPELLVYTVDRSPHKQGRFLPGARIPVYAPDVIRQDRPNYVLILPWNIRDEITSEVNFIRDWGGQFVVPIPSLQIV